MTPLFLLVGVLAGVLLAHPLDPPTLLVVGVLATAWRMLGGRTLFVLVLALGLLAGASADRAWRGSSDPRRGPVSGIVRLLSDPRPLPGGGWRAEVRLDGHRYDAEFPPRATSVGDLLAGEGIVVAGDLDGDPWRWQRIRHVEGTLEVASVDRILPAGPLHRLANALRRTLGRGTAPLPTEQASLLTGLVLGDDRAQDGRTADDFRAAGLGHLLAVSGQNVALVVAAAGPLLRRLRFRTRLPTTFLLLAFFALVTRFEPSVLRATVMAGGSATIAARGREADGLRLLSLTVVGLLLVDPLLVHRAAFQLSVAACAGILLGSSTLADLLPGPRPLREAAAVTLAAQSAVAPLLLLLFGPVPVAALPANLLAAPVAGPLMVWGLTGGLLAGVVGPPLDGLLHLPSGFGLGWIGGMAAWAGRHPIGLLGGPAALATSALVAGAVLCARRSARRAGHLALLLLGVILVASAHSAWTSVPGTGAAGGLRILDEAGTVIVVDEFRSAERLLADLRRSGVRAPSLFVFRAAIPPEVADALGERFPGVGLWGPPGSTGALSPPPGTVIRVGGSPGRSTPSAATSPFVGVRSREVAVVGLRSPPPCTVADVILELGPEHVVDITHRSVVMGILNRTTDSFFDQGRHWDFDAFLRLAERQVAEGADILDVGGIRAAPGPEVTAASEVDRVVPAVEALRERFDLPISVDTFRGSVIAEALAAGACIGNDISGFADPTFLAACARHGASVVATHVRIGPRIADPEPRYGDLRCEVRDFLAERGRWAEAAGIPRCRIMLDAGLDLGKTPSMSAELLRHSGDLPAMGYPVLLSASNKGFLGTLVRTEVDDRREATWAAHALGIGAGCRILRVHDVRGARRVADLMAAVLAEDEDAAREPVG